MESNIRKSSIAGSWYPNSPKVLQANIADFFRQVPDDPIEGRVMGMVAPHAGYVYSGQVAAYAYKLIQGQVFDAVIVIGPSHRMPFTGVSVYNRGGYETPLGTVAVDSGLADRLMAQSGIVSANPSVHMQEHSIEIHLPFLQAALGDFPFVPLLMGNQDRRTCEGLAEVIASAVGEKKVLLVGSSDLSHFHSYDEAVKLDSLALAYLDKLDPDGFLKDLEKQKFEACGGGPAAVAMMAAKRLGAGRSKLLKYANSGDVTGDRSSVVGYAAAVFYNDRESGEHADSRNRLRDGAGTGLTEGDRQTLLNIVRATIEAKLKGIAIPEPAGLTEILKKERGAFVTLKKHDRLRGCIGYIEARSPLYKTIEEMAAAAAFNDPRFPPLRQEEWKDVTIEISVLSPLKEIHDVKEIEVGRHGLYIMKGGRCGLLLPQVATEYNWDSMTFLKETCHKAGLPSHAWKDEDTKIFIFSADIFGSHE
ncbi:MAG: AmmeMemoRadiSam system protein B [Syntrophales bacterium]|nr:AmmeMemoRadiSam system protein B [Syntrophales bacterium]